MATHRWQPFVLASLVTGLLAGAVLLRTELSCL
jgi:hypothetical protein